MSTYVTEEIANNAADKGKLIGKTEPTVETKFSWWEVYEYEGKHIACVCTGDGVSCGEQIEPEEFHLYMDKVPDEDPGIERGDDREVPQAEVP